MKNLLSFLFLLFIVCLIGFSLGSLESNAAQTGVPASVLNNYVLKAGDTMTGTLTMSATGINISIGQFLATPNTTTTNRGTIQLYDTSTGWMKFRTTFATAGYLFQVGSGNTFNLTYDGKIILPSSAGIYDSNENELQKFIQSASASNEITVSNAATGNGPTLEATGSNTNIDLNLGAKGTGEVTITSLLRILPKAACPISVGTPEGSVWADGTAHELKWFDGTAWENLSP